MGPAEDWRFWPKNHTMFFVKDVRQITILCFFLTLLGGSMNESALAKEGTTK
jgi:hypothetical protein